MIEIELAKDGRKFRRNIVIKCTIKREGNKTIFSVNDKPQGKKAVIELCRELSIQIDNLCQFLPQDKVVEFAAMTPVELLKSTQRAVASQEMIHMHEELKDLRKKQKSVQEKCDMDQDALSNLESRQRGQEADVERMRERDEIVKRVEFLEAARPLCEYRRMRNVFAAAKERKKATQTELTRLKNEVQPSLRKVKEKDDYKRQIEAVVAERKGVVNRDEKHADNIDRKLRDLQDKSNEMVGAFDAERDSGKKHRQDVSRLELQVTELKRQMSREPPAIDPLEYNERLREKRGAMMEIVAQIGKIQDEQRENTHRGRDLNERIKRAEADLTNLDSQAGKQNLKLQNASRDSAKLWDWVQQHQDQFEKPILGPPMVECSVTDPKYVDQIEMLFQRTSFLGFTTQTRSDFKRLSDQAANMRLSDVNLKTVMHKDQFKPPVSQDEMRPFGFDSWAIDHIVGPEPILAWLCGDHHFHQTGIAVRDTSSQQFELLQNSPVGSWVTSKSHYRITRRREYGPGATSTQVKPMRSGTVWTDQPVDLTAKRELQERIQGWTDEIAELTAQNKEAQRKIEEHRREKNHIAEEEKELAAEKAAKQKALGEFRGLPTKLASLEEKMATSQEAIQGIRHRMGDIMDKQNELAVRRAQIALDFADAVEALRISHSNLHEAELMLIEASSDLAVLKERNSEVQEMLETQQRHVDQATEETAIARTQAEGLLRECGQLTNPATIDQAFKSFLLSLGDDYTTEELEPEIESERARLELMHEGGNGVIKEFETRQRKISGLRSKLEELKSALNELDDRIKELRDQWEPQLDSLVEKISNSFSYNMEQISYAGEVGVYKDEDFDQWAVQIRVKFRYALIPPFLLPISLLFVRKEMLICDDRENEPLTTLDSHRQSGGERAVSTIFYLMSLQSLTRSPFRVVDEINQGMDPRNERLVHKRMVGIACGKDDSSSSSSPGVLVNGTQHENIDDENGDGGGGSQYFLITPKLLHNLTYERGMRVLCIASGEYMPPDRQKIDFRGSLDLMKGLKASGFGGGTGVVAAG